MKKCLSTFIGFVILFVPGIFSQSFTDSNLPIIIIDTYGQMADTAYVAKKMGIKIIDNGPGVRNYITDSPVYSGLIKLRLRGTSSLGFPKKSFKITTIDSLEKKLNVSLLGMPEENDWVLKGIYPDKTLMRDELSFWVYNQMGRYSSRVQFVELVVNSSYRGVYAFLEKIKRDKNRVDISTLTANDTVGDELTGGYIFKLDKFLPIEAGWFSSFPSNSTHDSANYFLYDYPQTDSLIQVQKDYIKNYVDKFEITLASPWWNDADSGYTRYINIHSFMDNFILNELAKNVDGYRASTYFYKDKDSKSDGKVHSGPVWDYDIAWNNCYYMDGDDPKGWQYQRFPWQNFIPFWWWQMMSDTNFTNQLRCRWNNLRNTVLTDSNIFSHIDQVAGRLDEAQARNFLKWPILGVVVEPNPTPVPQTYPEEISNMKGFISQRLAWMDANLPGVCQTSVDESIANSNALSAYPNPFYNEVNISYKLPASGKYQLTLINIFGQEVSRLYDEVKNSGSYYDEYDLTKLLPGAYILRLSANDQTAYHKLIKQ